MTPVEELQSLIKDAQNPAVKQILTDGLQSLQTKAQTVIQTVEDNIHVFSQDAKDLWAKIKACL